MEQKSIAITETRVPLVAMTHPDVFATKPAACLYCPAPLPSTSEEHVFNSAWGGHAKSKWLICDACNAAFSHRVDTALLVVVRHVMNGFSIKGKRHKEPPSIPMDGGYVLRPYGRLETPTRVEAELDESGRIAVTGSAPDRPTALRATIEAAERAAGRPLTQEEHAHLKAQIKKAPVTSVQVGTLSALTTLDFIGGYQSAVHTALKVLSALEPETARSALYEGARQFARHGRGEWDEYAVTLTPLVDVVADVMSGPGWPLTNAVQIWFDAAGRQVLARLTVLGRVVRDVRLATGYDGPNRTLFVFEPFGHTERLPAIDATFAALPGHQAHGLAMRLVQAGPPPTFEQMGQDLARVMSQSVGADALSAALGDGVERVARRHPVFGPTAAAEFREVFADALARLSYLRGNPRPVEEARTLLDASGMEALGTQLEGRTTSDDDVQSDIADVFATAMSKWADQSASDE